MSYMRVCREREQRRCLLHNSTIFPNSAELLTTSGMAHGRLEREMKWIFQLLSRRYVKHEKLDFTRNGIRQIRDESKEDTEENFDQRSSVLMQFWERLSSLLALWIAVSLSQLVAFYSIINHVKYAPLKVLSRNQLFTFTLLSRTGGPAN